MLKRKNYYQRICIISTILLMELIIITRICMRIIKKLVLHRDTINIHWLPMNRWIMINHIMYMYSAVFCRCQFDVCFVTIVYLIIFKLNITKITYIPFLYMQCQSVFKTVLCFKCVIFSFLKGMKLMFNSNSLNQ